MKRRKLWAVVCALAMTLGLSGCGGIKEASTSDFAMDTVMTLTLYGPNQDDIDYLVSVLSQMPYQIEGMISTTAKDSTIYKLNHAGGEPMKVTGFPWDVLEPALALCERTDGALDITAYPAVRAWGFTSGEYRVPTQQELDFLKEQIDYTRVELDGASEKEATVTLPAGMELDLGAVGKGYLGDLLRRDIDYERETRELEMTSALLNLGQSTIVAVGSGPDGAPWRIGVQDPYGESHLGVLELVDQSMGSSGNYQRYFEEDGVRYGHIMDPDTAAPANSDLASVTVVADSALLCDGLSTALFVMGLEEAVEFWAENRDFEALFIGENGDITLTPGLKDSFELVEGYQGEVRILE